MKKLFWVTGALAAVVAIAVVAMVWFVPEGADQVDEELPSSMMMEEFTTISAGEFKDGDSSHSTSGTVMLLEGNEGFFLRFEDYQATSGPDVYFYLTEQANARSTGEVESGMKLLTPGGRDGGEATKRGNFNIQLAADFDPTKWHGITVWCDDFNVVFGTAALA